MSNQKSHSRQSHSYPATAPLHANLRTRPAQAIHISPEMQTVQGNGNISQQAVRLPHILYLSASRRISDTISKGRKRPPMALSAKPNSWPTGYSPNPGQGADLPQNLAISAGKVGNATVSEVDRQPFPVGLGQSSRQRWSSAVLPFAVRCFRSVCGGRLCAVRFAPFLSVRCGCSVHL